jgi:hypothetical protein
VAQFNFVALVWHQPGMKGLAFMLKERIRDAMSFAFPNANQLMKVMRKNIRFIKCSVELKILLKIALKRYNPL